MNFTTSHKQFEYLTVELRFQWTNPPVLQYKAEMPGQGAIETPDISVLGTIGWELVTILERSAYNTAGQPKPILLGVFKRELKTE